MNRGPPLTPLELANVSYWAAFKVLPSLIVVVLLLSHWGVGLLSVAVTLWLGTGAFLLLGALGERLLPAWQRLFGAGG